MSNGFQLKEHRFRLDKSKKALTMRVVEHWNMLPGEVFKARLDGPLSNLVK